MMRSGPSPSLPSRTSATSLAPAVPWLQSAAARSLFGLVVVVALAATLIGESRIAAERGEILGDLAVQRTRIVTITSIRRDCRKTQVALLERWLAAPEQRGSAGHEVRMMVAEVMSEAKEYMSQPSSVREEEAYRAQFLDALQAWSSDIDDLFGVADGGLSAARLRADVEAMDHTSDLILRVNAAQAKAADARVAALGRVQLILGFSGLALVLLAGAWWWRTKVAADVRVAAAERGHREQRELVKAQAELFATMSHELRTPIVTVRSLASGIKDRSVAGDDIHSAADQIAREATELLAVINNILDAAKLESATVELLIEEVDIRAVLERSLDRCHGLAAGKLLDLRIVTDDALPPVRGDFVKLQQVFTNLIGNAIKFTSQGQVTIRASVEGDGRGVVVEVTDTGIGIESSALRRIWRPFRQANGGISRVHGGTGLGLSIVRTIVSMHGGTVDVMSQPGAGSTFAVHLPRAAFKETGSRQLRLRD